MIIGRHIDWHLKYYSFDTYESAPNAICLYDVLVLTIYSLLLTTFVFESGLVFAGLDTLSKALNGV
jgi:hypothetical protein